MNGVRRFTAERRDCNGASIIGDAHNNWTIWFKTAELRDAFVAQVNGTTTPADDLPPGVKWATVVAPDCDVPDGWEVPYNERASHNGYTFAIEVRPVQQPDTERVPWWGAVGRKDDAHQTISTVGFGSASACPFFITSGGLKRSVTAADGTVEVLVVGGASS